MLQNLTRKHRGRNPISGTQFAPALELLTLSYARNRSFQASLPRITTPPPGHVPLLIMSALAVRSLSTCRRHQITPSSSGLRNPVWLQQAGVYTPTSTPGIVLPLNEKGKSILYILSFPCGRTFLGGIFPACLCLTHSSPEEEW